MLQTFFLIEISITQVRMIDNDYLAIIDSVQSASIKSCGDKSDESKNDVQNALKKLPLITDTSSRQSIAFQQISNLLKFPKKELKLVLQRLRRLKIPEEILSVLMMISQHLQAADEVSKSNITLQKSLKTQQQIVRSIQVVIDCYTREKKEKELNHQKVLLANRQRLSKNHQIRAKLRKAYKLATEYYERRINDFRQHLSEQQQKRETLKKKYQSTKFINESKDSEAEAQILQKQQIKLGDGPHRGQPQSQNIQVVSLRNIDINDEIGHVNTQKEAMSIFESFQTAPQKQQSYIHQCQEHGI